MKERWPSQTKEAEGTTRGAPPTRTAADAGNCLMHRKPRRLGSLQSIAIPKRKPQRRSVTTLEFSGCHTHAYFDLEHKRVGTKLVCLTCIVWMRACSRV